MPGIFKDEHIVVKIFVALFYSFIYDFINKLLSL